MSKKTSSASGWSALATSRLSMEELGAWSLLLRRRPGKLPSLPLCSSGRRPCVLAGRPRNGPLSWDAPHSEVATRGTRFREKRGVSVGEDCEDGEYRKGEINSIVVF